ncbi:MAG: type II toxin-antitoxin system VapC family toxin [Propionibacteriaceae bacterium]|nr:type II toxin-antitoxin system VapC family toxin [Propionibacteriaceae bacterium]
MIVDTSALVAVLTGEPDAEAHLAAMASADELAVSAATLVEAGVVLVVKQGREAFEDLQSLLAELEVAVIGFDEEQALLAIRAWERFGRGRHPAALTLGDLFAYAAAQRDGQELLFKGNDFAQTDVAAAR